MGSPAIDVYNHYSELIGNAQLDLNAITAKVSLHTSAYTFAATHQQYSDLAGELATGSGYTSGGETVANLSLARSGLITTWDGNDVVWSAATFTVRRAVLRAVGSIFGLTDPLLFSILFDDAPADVSVTNSNFTIAWNALGIGRLLVTTP